MNYKKDPVMKKLMLALLLLLFSTSVFAHDYWLTVDNYSPKVNDEITVTVCYGHTFPSDGTASSNNIDRIVLVEPDGVIKNLPFKTEGDDHKILPITVKMTKQGTNYIVLYRKPGFSSHTTTGYVSKPKDEVENVIETSYSEGCRITSVTVGKSSGALPASVFGQNRFRLETDADLGNVKVGDTIPVKLFLDGEPYRTYIYATYDTFSQEKDTYAYATRIPSADLTGKITITHPGLWIIVAKDDIPYTDPAKADNYSFGCNITFMAK